MKFPKFLDAHGAIGFPAPSFGCATQPYRSAFTHALELFREKGHTCVPGPNAYAEEGVGISSTPQKCGEEMMKMYLSKNTQALISCGGGELMCEILEFIDFDAIKRANPKWFMGYSDNTNLTFLLTTLCDVASVYASCASSFGMEPWDASIEDSYRLLRGEKLSVTGYPLYEKESLRDEEHPLAPYNLTEKSRIRVFPGESVSFSGRLIGGCMDCLVNLTGTKYDKVADFAKIYKEDGLIWFLESCDLNVFAIRRAIWQMKNAGWFAHVKGFLIGRPLCNGQEIMGLDQYEAVLYHLREYGVPVLMDMDFGHLPPRMPLVTGSLTRVTFSEAEQDLQIQMQMK